jgi:hypothetical protein
VSKSSNQTESKPVPKPGAAPNPAASEAEFLAQQAADAKAAITRAISQIGAELGKAVNPSGVMHSHPWLTLGATTIAGFVAAAAVVPSKEEQALRKLSKIEKALHPPPHRPIDDYSDDDDSEAKHARSRRRGLATAIVDGVFKTLQPILLSTLSAAVARPSQEEMQAAAAAEDQGVPADGSANG